MAKKLVSAENRIESLEKSMKFSKFLVTSISVLVAVTMVATFFGMGSSLLNSVWILAGIISAYSLSRSVKRDKRTIELWQEKTAAPQITDSFNF